MRSQPCKDPRKNYSRLEEEQVQQSWVRVSLACTKTQKKSQVGKIEKKLQNLVQAEGGNVDRSESQEGSFLPGVLHFYGLCTIYIVCEDIDIDVDIDLYYRSQDSEGT